MPAFLPVLICLVTALELAACQASPRAAKPMWTDIPQAQWREKGIQVPGLAHYRVLKLDTALLRRLLDGQTGTDLRQSQSFLLLPLPDGSMAKFRFVPALTTMPPPGGRGEASRTYFGQGIQDAALGLAFDLGPAGFHAMISRGGETIFIEPLNLKGDRYYLCFFKQDLKPGYRRPFEEYGPIRKQ